jgi:hypothetical protein
VLLGAPPRHADTRTFELTAPVGTEIHGILSKPFLDANFRTLSYRITVTLDSERDTWSYESEGLLMTPDRDQPFRPTDANTLLRVGAPRPNPLAPSELSRGS